MCWASQKWAFPARANKHRRTKPLVWVTCGRRERALKSSDELTTSTASGVRNRWPTSESGHFRPIRPVLPTRSCPLCPDSGPGAGRDGLKARCDGPCARDSSSQTAELRIMRYELSDIAPSSAQRFGLRRLSRISRNSFGPLRSLRLRLCRSSSVADRSVNRSTA